MADPANSKANFRKLSSVRSEFNRLPALQVGQSLMKYPGRHVFLLAMRIQYFENGANGRTGVIFQVEFRKFVVFRRNLTWISITAIKNYFPLAFVERDINNLPFENSSHEVYSPLFTFPPNQFRPIFFVDAFRFLINFNKS